MTDTSFSPALSSNLPASAQQVVDYWVDSWQRTILFWDVLRQRSNQYYEQEAKEVPHVLSFEHESVLDGRTFERPVNYGLVRIKPPSGVAIDPKKRPFVVVDPRAGHGPGIGGFKADSELGMAMRAGHPCYFVGFSPDPMPGQTIEDVMRAEAVFLEKVIALHPDADGKPCVIGNCQAGWAVMMLAATRPELFGPIIIPGAPLSCWAGVDERAFNELREIRDEHRGMSLEEFKQTLREQFFALLLDRGQALAAIPRMLPAAVDARMPALEAIRRIVSAAGEVTGQRAERLSQLEALFGAVV